jgi:hypothetical protein
MKTTLRAIIAALALLTSIVWIQPVAADETTDTAETYTLRYRFEPNSTLRSKVVHLVTVETRIKGTSQVAKTRSASTKVWKIQKVDDQGQTTFVHSVAHVDMWQSVTGRQVVRFNSATDEQPPAGYEEVARSVGVPLATVTIDATGRVVDRKDNRPQFNPGIGDLTVPLPETPVAIGQRWTEEDEVQLRLPGEPIKRIKTRQVYSLRSVKTGVATIDVKTEVLTPIDDPALEAQMVQRLQQGHVRFDIDAGRLLSRQMDMDKTVIGFNGADSQMEYLARFTEEMSEGEADDEEALKATADDQDSSPKATTTTTATAEPAAAEPTANKPQPLQGPEIRR